MDAVNVEEVVRAYLNIRAERERILREYEQKDAELLNDMRELDAILLSVCNQTNVNSLNTKAGTVIKQLKQRFICEDWENFRKFELENPEYDFRERRIHQNNFKQYVEQHEGDGLPPGVSTLREFTIVVRKSQNK